MNDCQFEEQIGRICRDDKEGLRRIYEDYNPLIYSVAAGILHNHEDAEDVASEFFIRLWNIAPSYRKGQGHRAWMVAIVHNMSIDYLRKTSREQTMEEMPEPKQQEWQREDNQLVSRISLEQALNTLEEEERQIVNLKIMGELTFREIAKLLKRPLGTVAWRYRTAIGKLRRCGYDGR